MSKALSVIIVNWNSADYLRECLASLYAETAGIALEVIVVDNGPFDGSAEALQRVFPGITVVTNTHNGGFSQANNLGFRYSSGSRILFLNPDTRIMGPAIAAMLRELDLRPDAGIAGCRLLNTDLSVQTSCIQRFPTILNQALTAEELRVRFPRLKLWGIAALFDGCRDAVPVDIISGACLMIKRDVFERAGLFSEEYFMYAEDVHLCYAVHKLGLRAYYVPGGTVVHHGGGSSSRSERNQFVAVMQRRAMSAFFCKTRGPVYAAGYRLAMGLAAACRIAMLLAASPRAMARQKWTAVLRWAVGLEQPRVTQ